MTHFDALEPRRLFAAGLDPTFAENGVTPFQLDYSILGVLPVKDKIYLDTYHGGRRRYQVFRLNEDGSTDTTWGRNGYIVPTAYADVTYVERHTMAFDDRTGGLLIGAADGNTIAVERHRADGSLDTAWGDNGRTAYAERKAELKLEAVVPMAGKRVMLAFDRDEQRAKYNARTGRREGAADVAVLRLDGRGRYDRAFNNGRVLTVAGGSYAARFRPIDEQTDLQTETFSDPTFGDLQFRKDGGFRVVVTRVNSVIETELEPTYAYRTKHRGVTSAESIVVSGDGALRPKMTGTYTLKRETGGSGFGTTFRPAVAVARADGAGIAILASLNDNGVAVVRVGPGLPARPMLTRLPGAFRYIVWTGRGVDGSVVVRNPDGPRLLKLDSDLAPVGRLLKLDPERSDLSPITTDEQGRLLGVYGRQVARYTFR